MKLSAYVPIQTNYLWIFLAFSYFFLKFIYLFWERERERESTHHGRGRESGERESQAGLALSAQGPRQGLIPWTMRSWHEPKPESQTPKLLSHPGTPTCFSSDEDIYSQTTYSWNCVRKLLTWAFIPTFGVVILFQWNKRGFIYLFFQTVLGLYPHPHWLTFFFHLYKNNIIPQIKTVWKGIPPKVLTPPLPCFPPLLPQVGKQLHSSLVYTFWIFFFQTKLAKCKLLQNKNKNQICIYFLMSPSLTQNNV